MAKKRKRVKVVPRLGPPSNLRPAGAHKDRRRKPRAAQAKELLEEAALERPVEES